MSLRERDIHVTSPCPIDLDETGTRGAGSAWHCGHCSKTVHVLSSMTESQARTFLVEHAGQDVCVSYAMSHEGQIRFRPEPVVPVSALSRRPHIAAAAALGLSVAMAACAPHESQRVQPAPVIESLPIAIGMPTIPTLRPEPPQPEVIQVAGGMIAEPIPVPEPPKLQPEVRPDIQVDGGLRAPEPTTPTVVDAPCDPPREPVAADQVVMTRGGLRPVPRGR